MKGILVKKKRESFIMWDFDHYNSRRFWIWFINTALVSWFTFDLLVFIWKSGVGKIIMMMVGE